MRRRRTPKRSNSRPAPPPPPRRAKRHAVIGPRGETGSPSPSPGSGATAPAARYAAATPRDRSAAPPRPRRNSANVVIPFDTFQVLDGYKQNLRPIGPHCLRLTPAMKPVGGNALGAGFDVDDV